MVITYWIQRLLHSSLHSSNVKGDAEYKPDGDNSVFCQPIFIATMVLSVNLLTVTGKNGWKGLFHSRGDKYTL